MEGEIRERLSAEGIDDEQVRMDHTVKMRYAGQWRSLEVPCSRPLSDIDAVRERFHRQHEQTYAYSDEDQPVEIYGLHVTGSGLVRKPSFPKIGDGSAADAHRTSREAYFASAGGYVQTDVYTREALGAGATFTGPAIVEQMDSTVVVPPSVTAEVDDTGNILLSM